MVTNKFQYRRHRLLVHNIVTGESQVFLTEARNSSCAVSKAYEAMRFRRNPDDWVVIG
jgi:hypothetical protein